MSSSSTVHFSSNRVGAVRSVTLMNDVILFCLIILFSKKHNIFVETVMYRHILFVYIYIYNFLKKILLTF